MQVIVKYISEHMIVAMSSSESFLNNKQNADVEKTHTSIYDSCIAICRELINDAIFRDKILDILLKQQMLTAENALYCAILCLSVNREIPTNIWCFLEENLTTQEYCILRMIRSNMQKNTK